MYYLDTGAPRSAPHPFRPATESVPSRDRKGVG